MRQLLELFHHPKVRAFCAGLWWSDGKGGDPFNPNTGWGMQDEWLITPNMDSSKYENLQLTFYSVYNMMRGWTNPMQNNFVKYSTDGGTTWISFGDLNNDAQFDFNGCTGGPLTDPTWNWNDVQIVLNLPDSDQLMIAWHYYWNGTGTAGIWMVDDVNIIGKKSINSNEQADLCEIDEPLIIPRVKQISNLFVVRILERFQTQFPMLKYILTL